MMKIRKKPVFGIMLLLMLGASPISVTYSFADISKTGQYETHENQLHIEKNAKNENALHRPLCLTMTSYKSVTWLVMKKLIP